MNLTTSTHNRKLRLILWLAVFALFELPALSCGPDFPVAIFTLQHGPDHLTAYAAGHIGVPQPNYRTRSLVIAYDWLTAHPLSVDGQKQAIAVNHQLLAQDSFDDATKPPANPSGFDSWMKARAAFGAVDGYTPDPKMDTFATITGQDYFQYPNCLDDSFATATKTLAARAASYGAKDPAVVEWVRGQDAVFNNCPGKPSPQAAASKTAAPLTTPAAAAVNAPTWLKQDRAYQIAAANFYAENYDASLADFRAIATDTVSPWSAVSRYLVARTLIRKATMTDSYINGPADPDAAKMKAAADQLHATLGLAQKELLAMQAAPPMAQLKSSIDGLLDYVNLRYEPDAQADVLATRLHTTGAPSFGQALIDLTYLRVNSNTTGTMPLSDAAVAGDKTGMLKWINSFNDTTKKTALAQWRATKNNAWLLAALAQATPGDATNATLISAAQAVPASDPAWTAITYHRLRLMPRGATMRTALLAVLPQITKNESVSTVNLFTELNAETAPTLEDWLAAAGPIPASETSWGEEVGSLDSKPVDQLCGAKLAPDKTHLFTQESADVLNMLLPLDELATAAESKTLPPNLHFQVAQSAWARAVLLDRPEIAKRMTPLLVACRPAWKTVLAAYDSAATSLDRKANSLLALMRFASTEPNVRGGEQRFEGFATYSMFRDNWWCTVPPQAANGPSDDATVATPKPPAARPPFVTAADRAKALSDLQTLQSFGSASTYFANQALAWYKAHPTDPRDADILGEANQVLRNSCRDEKLTPPLAHALFDALHQHFPQSAWTKKYKTWE